MERLLFKSERGASLVEALIGIAVGSILIVSGIALLNVSLRTSLQNKYMQSAALLGNELMSKVGVYIEKKWLCVENATTPTVPGCGLYNLTKGTHYIITAESGTAPFKSAEGEETVVIDGISFTRYFTVENVSRTAQGYIATEYDPLAEDPSTQKVAVHVVWLPDAGKIKNVKYFTRSKNVTLRQTDWSGGNSQASFPSNQVNNKFDTSQNIDHTEFGILKITGF
jgi:hypothetical protein